MNHKEKIEVLFEMLQKYWQYPMPNTVSDDRQRFHAYGYLEALHDLEEVLEVTFSDVTKTKKYMDKLEKMDITVKKQWKPVLSQSKEE